MQRARGRRVRHLMELGSSLTRTRSTVRAFARLRRGCGATQGRLRAGEQRGSLTRRLNEVLTGSRGSYLRTALRNGQRDGRPGEEEQRAPHRRDDVAVNERVGARGGGIGNEM